MELLYIIDITVSLLQSIRQVVGNLYIYGQAADQWQSLVHMQLRLDTRDTTTPVHNIAVRWIGEAGHGQRIELHIRIINATKQTRMDNKFIHCPSIPCKFA